MEGEQYAVEVVVEREQHEAVVVVERWGEVVREQYEVVVRLQWVDVVVVPSVAMENCEVV